MGMAAAPYLHARPQLGLIKRECASRRIAVSEFVTQSTMANIKLVRNRAITT
jgi:hypothetical protein